MNKYVTVFTAKPAVKLKPGISKIDLIFLEGKKSIRAIVEKIEEPDNAGSIVQTGLKITVFIEASNLDEAIREGGTRADGIMSLMTLVTGVGIPVVRRELGYEVTPGKSERAFIQFFHDLRVKPQSRRELDHTVHTKIIDKTLGIDRNWADRIFRAVRWYRSGVSSRDVFDRFACFWIGLEALNPLFQEKLNVKDDTTSCPECGHTWSPVPTVSGIRIFVKNHIRDGDKLYRKIRSLRIHIFHSRKSLYNIIGDVKDLSPKLGKILVSAILFLLEYEDWETLPKDVITNIFPIKTALIGKLIGGDPRQLGPHGKHPHLEITKIQPRSRKKEDGTMTYDIKAVGIARLSKNVKLSIYETRVYGEEISLGTFKFE